MKLLHDCIAEAAGAFAIVFFGCGAVIANQLSGGAVSHVGISLTFGLVVMVMIYATGHISGAHFNPAVTIAFAAAEHFPMRKVPLYIISQCAGAALASFVQVWLFKPILANVDPQAVLNLGVTQPMDGSSMTALVLEFILTAMLMFVIISVATDCCAVGQMAGLAIGATVALEAMAFGPLCGASMNSARSFGPALAAGQWDHFWAYVAGPVAGALAGAFLYEYVRCCKDKKQNHE